MCIDTLHPFTLKEQLGTLTMVWVVPLSRRRLTPAPPFPKSYDVIIFGVEQETEEFLPLNL